MVSGTGADSFGRFVGGLWAVGLAIDEATDESE